MQRQVDDAETVIVGGAAVLGDVDGIVAQPLQVGDQPLGIHFLQ